MIKAVKDIKNHKFEIENGKIGYKKFD